MRRELRVLKTFSFCLFWAQGWSQLKMIQFQQQNSPLSSYIRFNGKFNPRKFYDKVKDTVSLQQKFRVDKTV